MQGFRGESSNQFRGNAVWDRVDFELETLATLEFEEATRHFEQLEETEPDIAKAVSSFVNRKRSADSFLKTSSPQAQYPDFIDSISAGTQIGNWKLGELLGLGGMGAVYKAERADGVYEHVAAAKIVRIQSDAQRKRFDQERQRLANLEHPAVVRIIDGGVFENDLSYLIMDFVDGMSLDEYLERNNINENKKLDKILDVAKAVEYVHRRSILHRDLKPSNVLVTADGQVKLIDFGIASEISEDVDTPRAMTFAYAAPEQLTNNEATIATDIFSLGVLLHKVLLGDLPKRQSDAGVIISNAKINKELKAIISRAVATSPDDRYSSVSSLIADLERYLNREPVAAYSNTRSYKFSKFLKRNPVVSATASALVLALVGGLTSTSLALKSANTERDRAETALEEVEVQFQHSEAMLLAANSYADLLFGEFSGDEKTEELSSRLLESWEQAFDKKETDPDKAAALSFSLFRNFYLRRDFPNAKKIASTWLADKTGPEALVEAGEYLYAMFLFDSGEREEALPLLRKTLARYEASKTSTMDKMALANRISHITGEDSDLDKAEGYMHTLVDEAVRPENYIEAFGSLGISNEKRKKFSEAAGYFKKALEQFDLNPELKTPARGLIRARLSRVLLIELGQVDEAISVAKRVVEQDKQELGNSAIIGRGYYVLSRAYLVQGDFAQAGPAFEEEITLGKTYEGKAGASFYTQVLQAVLDAELGDADAAQFKLNGMKAESEENASMLAVGNMWVKYTKGENKDELLEQVHGINSNNSEVLFWKRILAQKLSSL